AKIEGGENVISSGNLELTVTDSAIGDADKEALKSSDAAAGVTVSQWLEVDLMQIVNQGNTTDVWTTDLEELPSKITVTLNVGTGLDASKQYVVVREHKGVYEQIPATYDQAAGTLTFESDKFSGYAVGTVQDGQGVVDTGNNTNTSSGNSSGASNSNQTTPAQTENKVEKVSVAVEYTVLKGDNLSRIARKHNMTLSALLTLNPQIKNPNRIYPGQKIIVGYTEKTVGSQTTAIENAEYYTVQRGDSLYKIARKNGLTLAQLAELNPRLMTQKYIYAGQKIRVK
ncbi:MAG: LysM peptidoglycan-binding domain-containing protein, partial [Lachnospiraceae bacterium]